MRKIRAVVITVMVLALVGGVLGASATGLLESPDRKDAYRSPWVDGANVLRVQRVGEHFVLLTIDVDRIVEGKHIERRTGSILNGDHDVYLLADAYGHAQLDGKRVPQEWWDAALGIVRKPRGENLSPVPLPLPSEPSFRSQQ